MNDVFILGAGFSKSIHNVMPTMNELSTEVLSDLEKLNLPVPPALYDLGNNIELWMTYLSQRQPWLKNYNNDHNLSVAGHIRQLIKKSIDDRTSKAAESDTPGWLKNLIKSLHNQRATLITLNYDTLIERAARELQITDDIQRILAQQMYPPYFSNVASRSGVGLWGEDTIMTFSYLKLHGSVNWYYSGRSEFYGETIFFADVPPLGTDNSSREKSLSMLSKDKEALIIPPVHEKTTYFNNETIRGLWQDAGDALAKASRVFVIGYSLPISDLGMQLFLINNQPNQRTPVYVVDIDPEVAQRYEEWLPKLNINKDFAHEQNPVAEFAEHYPSLDL
ncbi:MAG: SIR2 family protein [Candidatus Poribacteria bacterium]|nr:SIR2 family protein [Candidatus Poribacteria bacterium]